MTFEKYQTEASKLPVAPSKSHDDWRYPITGLGEEVGELAKLFQRWTEGEGRVREEVGRLAIRDELADMLWYLASLCKTAGLSLDDVATASLTKIADRRGSAGQK